MHSYRIYTEDVNRSLIIEQTAKYFDGATFIPALGRYKGTPESSLIIEVWTDDPPKVRSLACVLQLLNSQESVGIVYPDGHVEFTNAGGCTIGDYADHTPSVHTWLPPSVGIVYPDGHVERLPVHPPCFDSGECSPHMDEY